MAVYPKHLGKHQIEPSFWCFKDKVMKKTVKLGKKKRPFSKTLSQLEHKQNKRIISKS